MASSNRQILTEFINPIQAALTTEVDNETKKLWLRGVFVQGDVENANSRIYPRDEISRAVESLTKRIAEHGPVAGELDHPEGLMISGQNVSHAIHEMWMEGSNGIGKLLIINEGKGKIVRSMVEAGIHLGVSSRGSGSVDGKGHVSDFDIVTVDIVMTPSAPQAYPKPVFETLLGDRLGQELKYLSDLREDRNAQRYFRKTLHDYLMKVRDEVIWRKK